MASPTLNNGKKWRVAYYEGGPFIDYNKILYVTINGLMDLHWIEKTKIPDITGEDARPLWNWVSQEAKSDYLEFPKDAFYSSDWNEELRLEVSKKLLKRLIETKDIDILIGAGTQAGQDFSRKKCHRSHFYHDYI